MKKSYAKENNMRYLSIKFVLAAIPLCFLQIIVEPVSAYEGFDSTELKKLRFISRSILEARVQEKNKIEKEIEPLKLKLLAAQTELSNIDGQIKKDMMAVDLKKTTTTSLAQTSKSGKSAIANKASLEAKKAKIRSTKNKLKSKRVAMESEIPKFWQFWKTKTENDKRKELIVKKLNDIESELVGMETSGEIDYRSIKKLKRKIKLQRPKISFEKIDPTFQTRTKHRNQ